MFDPILVFSGPATLHMSWDFIGLSVLSYILCCIVCISSYIISKRWWQDKVRNIISENSVDKMAAGTSNTGYTGLPVVISMFDHNAVSIYIFIMMGVSLYENSLGYYIATKGC